MGRPFALITILITTITSACVPVALGTPYVRPDGVTRSARLIIAGNALLATHPASRTITRLDRVNGRIEWQSSLGCEPGTVAAVEEHFAVTCPDSGEVVVLDRRGSVVDRRVVGSGAFGVLYAGRLYITLSDDGVVLSLDPTTLIEIDRAPAGLRPRGLALKDDILYVVDGLDASVRLYDPRDLAPIGLIEVGQQAGVAESISPHPSEPRLYAPHTRLNVTNLARQFDTTLFPTVASIDLEARSVIRRESLSLDSVDMPVGMPLAVAIDALRDRLYSVNASSDDVSIVDLASGIGVGHVDVGQRPRDIAIAPDSSTVYTLDQHGGTITVIDAEQMKVAATLTYARDPRPASIRQGERLFTTSRPTTIARDRWISCATCHLDGGADGQTWLGTENGPRNTPTLRGLAGTEPFHWSGDREDIRAFQKTFTGLMEGTGLSDPELDALADFIESLHPLRSPRRDPDGSLTAAAESGAGTFQRVGCASCHTPPLFTDRRLHDVGTGAASGSVAEVAGPRFKTPSLRELWLTAPYLHDGRAATLRDAVAAHAAARLDAADLNDLEAFLLQLPLSDEETSRLFPR